MKLTKEQRKWFERSELEDTEHETLVNIIIDLWEKEDPECNREQEWFDALKAEEQAEQLKYVTRILETEKTVERLKRGVV